MLDFVCIFSIFLEVILTTVIINRVIKLEKKVEECEKSIRDYEEKIAVQTEIMNQNNATAKALDAKIKQANPLVEKLNNKLNEKEK